MRILVPAGTRPEFVKLAPVVRALREADHAVRVVATGQHVDPAMAADVVADLGLVVDDRWTLPGTEAARLASLFGRAFTELAERRPDLVLVLGDTWTVPVFALAARRHAVPSAHLEAGLRSGNDTSVEEGNRRVAAVLASLHFAPTPLAARALVAEGVPEARIRVVGNPVLDGLLERGVVRREVTDRRGVVVTAHRATNVDDPERLARLVALVRRLADDVGPVTFPLHPRTRDRLAASGGLAALRHPGIDLHPPVGYSEMVDLVAGARVVVTDSGGLQEEAAWLGVPVVVLRPSTPRWEGVLDGTSAVVGLDVDRAVVAAAGFATMAEQVRVAGVPCPYGDGHAADRVVRALADPAVHALCAVREPPVGAMPAALVGLGGLREAER